MKQLLTNGSTLMAVTICLSLGCLVSWSLGGLSAQEQGPTVRLGDTDKTDTGQNLLQNSGFEEGEGDTLTGWGRRSNTPQYLRWDRTHAHSGQASISFTYPAGEQGLSGTWRQQLERFPVNRKVHLRGYARTQEVSKDGLVILWVLGKDEEGGRTCFGTTEGKVNLTGTHNWTLLEAETAVPVGTAALYVIAWFSGTGQVWFDDIELTVGAPAQVKPVRFQRLKGPGIARAKGAYIFTATQDLASAKIGFPLPPAFEDQAPLHFEVIAKPKAAVKEWRLQERHPHHWVVELTFAPLKAGEEVDLEWRCLVLIRDRDYSDLPKEAALPRAEDLPEEVRTWLASTVCVQANDPQVVAKAKELRGESNNLTEIADRFTKFPQEVKGPDAPQLDAVTALTHPGSCTSFANVAAALFRASGVPARVLAVYPIDSQPFQTHYIVQYFVPGYGWVRAESARSVMPWPAYKDVVVNVVYPEDEDRSFELPRWASEGVPYLSLTELLSDDFTRFQAKLNLVPEQECDHAAEPVVEFPKEEAAAWAKAFALTQQVWAAYLDAKRKGRDVALALAVQKAAAESKTLAEYIGKMEEAARVYGELEKI